MAGAPPGGTIVGTVNTFVRILAIVGAVAIVAVIAAAVTYFGGTVDVGALAGHSGPVESFLADTAARSIRAHARTVAIPTGVNLHDPALAQRAVADYNEMCALCHGAPGRKAAFWTRGLYPPAPDLADRTRESGWSDAEVYWIIKHGIKDTGMTAFGATHQEDELWALTALVHQFLTMTPQQFADWSAHAKAEPEEDHHEDSH